MIAKMLVKLTVISARPSWLRRGISIQSLSLRHQLQGDTETGL